MANLQPINTINEMVDNVFGGESGLCNQIRTFSRILDPYIAEILRIARQMDNLVRSFSDSYEALVRGLIPPDIDLPNVPSPTELALLNASLSECQTLLSDDTNSKLNDIFGSVSDAFNDVNEFISKGENLYNSALESMRQNALDQNPFAKVKSLEGMVRQLLNKKIPILGNRSVLDLMNQIRVMASCCDATMHAMKLATESVDIFYTYFTSDGIFQAPSRYGTKVDTQLKNTGTALNRLSQEKYNIINSL